MTLEQILSPAVMDWLQENKDIPKEQSIEEFDKWLVNNEQIINESVKNNIDEINECIKKGCEKTRLLFENFVSDDEIDDLLNNMTFDDEGGKNNDDENNDDENNDGEQKDKPISGGNNGINVKDLVNNPDAITKKYILTHKEWKGNLSESNNIYDVINSVYSKLEERKISKKPNYALWSKFNVSKVETMAALFAFTDLRDADLSSWDTGKVKTMEGMFYKSTFNNDSICEWDVSKCVNFKRMFTHCNFNQPLSRWSPGFEERQEYNSDGKPIKGKTVSVQVELPLIGANADEENEMLNKHWESVIDSLLKESNNTIKNNKIMKHVLDYETFINEGFGDFLKKGIDKIKSFLSNMTVKIDNFVAMFDKNGKLIEATSPYTSLNLISSGKIKGVTAFTSVKNEFINNNVQSTASIVESPEYYGIVDEDSIEYRNYLTMVKMVNEHYEKYGNKLNEARVGFSGDSGGLTEGTDINSSRFKELLDTAIRTTPGELGNILDEEDDEDDDLKGGSILVFGSPGVGKSTIPKCIINEWNKNNETNKKALMVVECGDLTIDGFSLPIPTKMTLKDFLNEHPEVKAKAMKKGLLQDDPEYLNKEIDVSIEALKTWLPFYRKGATEEETIMRNDVCNGHTVVKNTLRGIKQIETTEGGILLFDEFFRANEQIFHILMQIVLNRTFNNGEYILGDKWAIICCSNRPNDDFQVKNSIKTSPGATLGTRFGGGVYNFIPDFNDWKKWAVKKGHFDDLTINFLMEEKDPNNGEYTNWHTIEQEGASKNKLGYPTPRTWSALMRELYLYMKVKKYSSIEEIPSDFIKDKASALLGKMMATKYVNYLNVYRSRLINYNEVLNNKEYVMPKNVDTTCAEFIKGLLLDFNAKFDKETLPKDEVLSNIFNFINKCYNPTNESGGGSKDNIIRPFYATVFNNLGFFEDKRGFISNYPIFTKLIMKQYNLKTGNDVTEFVTETPTM